MVFQKMKNLDGCKFCAFIALLLVNFIASATDFSTTYTVPIKTDVCWITNFTPKYSASPAYCVIPALTGGMATANYNGVIVYDIFSDKQITSDVKVTLNVAKYDGSNPKSGTFSLYADTDLKTAVTSEQTGTLPTNSTYTDVVYTVKKDNTGSFTKDLVVKIVPPSSSSYIRFHSITVEFSYEGAVAPTTTSLSFGADYDGKTMTKTFAFDMLPFSTPATLSDGPADAVITYSSSNPDVATISQDGMVSVLQPGETTISAAYAGDDNYTASSCSYVLSVGKIESSTTFSNKILSKKVGDPDFVNPAMVNTDRYAPTYACSDESVATVDAATGLVHIVGGGFATITATFAENTYFLGSGDSYVINVSDPTADPNRYVRVTAIDQLVYGDKLVFLDYNLGHIMSALLDEPSKHYRSAITGGFTLSSDKQSLVVTDTDNVAVITLEKGVSDDTYALHSKDGYICSTADNTANQDVIDDNASAIITFSSGKAHIQFQGKNKRNMFEYNYSIEIFNCYEPNQAYHQSIAIFKALNPNPSAPVTLKELVEAGMTEGDVSGKQFSLDEPLQVVAELPGNKILVKDASGSAVESVTRVSGERPYTITAHSFFSDDDAIEHTNTLSQDLYDQSNWVEIQLPSTLTAADYVNKIIAAGSFKGCYKDVTNPCMELADDATLTIESDAEPYSRNAMCPANFMGTTQECANHSQCGTYFFVTPKPNECVQVVWAVYDGEDGAFYIPSSEGNANSHGFVGGFDIDLAYNANQALELVDGGVYQFKAIVKKKIETPASSKRKVAYDSRTKSSDYVVYPLNLDNGNNLVTHISEPTVDNAEKRQRIYSITGAELPSPAPGVNIILTPHPDGTITAQKLLK